MAISPSVAVEGAFRALDAHDWLALFALLDPDAIAGFKARQLRHLEFEQATRDEFSELSRTVPESAEVGAPHGGLLEHVFAVQDLGAFAALPAPLVLRRWLMVARGRTPTERSPERHVL